LAQPSISVVMQLGFTHVIEPTGDGDSGKTQGPRIQSLAEGCPMGQGL